MSYYLCCTKTCIALWSTDAARMVASSRNSTATLRCLVHVKPGKLSQSRDASVLLKRHPRTKSRGIALLMPAKNLGCWSLRQSAQLLSAGRAGYTEPGVKNVSCSKKCQDGKLVEEGKPRPSWVAIMALLFSFGAASTVVLRQKGWYTTDKWDYEWDKDWRPNPELEEDVGETLRPFTRHILLIRHGQYENVAGANDETQGLTALGRSQAEETGQRLRSLLTGKRLVGIYHSNLKRARETADLIAAQLGDEHTAALVQDPLLAEGVPSMPIPPSATFNPSPEEVSTDSKRIEEAFRRYFYRSAPCNSDVHKDPPELSSTRSGVAPMPNEQRFPTEDYTVLVCHGNVIRYFFCRALQLPTSAWLRLATFNCGLTWISIDRRGFVSARHFGDVGHLDSASITYS